MGKIALLLILLIATFLRSYRLPELMMFIGDQGWFYLSARDMIISGDIALVGVTSSHTWLHQGALWTYLLAPVLRLFNFNPVGGAYFSSLLGVITVWLVYKVGKEMFSRKIGLIAAFLCATSPLIIIHSRMAYHTSPIPFFTLLLFYFVWKWVNGGPKFFPLVVFLLAILYNFELATFTLVPIIAILILIGFATKKEWVRGLINRKVILLSSLGILIPMIPMIVYDFDHGFPQTIKFIVWVFYKIAVTLHLYPPLHPDAPSETYQTMIPFASTLIKRLIFLENGYVAWLIFAISVLYLSFVVYRLIKKKSYFNPFSILLLFFIIPTLGYISARTNSEGYILIFFPILMYMIALVSDSFMRYRFLLAPSLILLFVIGITNSYYFVSKDYLMKDGYGVPISERINVAKKIIQKSSNEEYNIIGVGDGSQHESFTMNYEYLTWWLGKPPSKKKAELQFIIRETSKEVILTKNID